MYLNIYVKYICVCIYEYIYIIYFKNYGKCFLQGKLLGLNMGEGSDVKGISTFMIYTL